MPGFVLFSITYTSFKNCLLCKYLFVVSGIIFKTYSVVTQSKQESKKKKTKLVSITDSITGTIQHKVVYTVEERPILLFRACLEGLLNGKIIFTRMSNTNCELAGKKVLIIAYFHCFFFSRLRVTMFL